MTDTLGHRPPSTVHRPSETASGKPTRNIDADADARAIPSLPSTWQLRLDALRNRVAGWVARVRTWGHPPDIASQPRPSLSAVWGYAEVGDYTHPEAGRLRTLGQVYAFLVAVPAHAALYLAAWILERPSRAMVTLAAMWSLWQWPPIPQLAHLATAPVRWLFGL